MALNIFNKIGQLIPEIMLLNILTGNISIRILNTQVLNTFIDLSHGLLLLYVGLLSRFLFQSFPISRLNLICQLGTCFSPYCSLSARSYAAFITRYCEGHKDHIFACEEHGYVPRIIMSN